MDLSFLGNMWDTLAKSFLASNDFWGGMQAFAATVALIAGVGWFLKRRQRWPKATIDHKLWSWKITDNEQLVRMVIVFENKGEVLLEPGSALVRLHFVLPISDDILEQLPSVRATKPGEKVKFEWAVYDEQNAECDRELEPNESDELSFHFLIPLQVQTVIAYSHVTNKRKERKPIPRGWLNKWQYLTNPENRKRKIGWVKTTVHDLHEMEVSTMPNKAVKKLPDNWNEKQGAPDVMTRPPRNVQNTSVGGGNSSGNGNSNGSNSNADPNSK